MSATAQAGESTRVRQPMERSISRTARKLFTLWTLAWWGGVGVCAFLFFFGVLDFVTSTKVPPGAAPRPPALFLLAS